MQAPKIQTPDMQGVIDAKRALSATVEDLAASQEKLAMLALDNKLQEVIEGLAPKAVVEKYKDATIHAEELGRVLKENNGITVERAQILADIAAREKIVRRELAETIEGVMDMEGIAHEKKLKIIEEWKAKVEETIHGNEKLKIKSYADEKTARLEHLDIAKKIAAVEAMARDAKAGTLNTKTNWITGHAQMQAGSTYDRSDRARIVTQGQLDARYAQYDEDGVFSGEGGAEALAQFQQFSETSLFNAERQAEMDGMMERFGQLSEIASGVGSAISTAFTQGFADILTGAKSVQEVLGNMFQGIADSFMQMAQKIIAEMIKMLILKTMLKIFGLSGTEVATDTGTGSFSGFESMSSGGFDFNTTPKGFSWPAMAKGGIVTGPTAAIIGEGGQNEAVVPLPNGKSIPVDFGKKGAGGDIQTNITVNVDQSGSTDTQVDGDSANKLGKAIDGAVKRVIMEERRSGGLLHNGRR